VQSRRSRVLCSSGHPSFPLSNASCASGEKCGVTGGDSGLRCSKLVAFLPFKTMLLGHSLAPRRTIYQSKLIEYDEERNLVVFWVRYDMGAGCCAGGYWLDVPGLQPNKAYTTTNFPLSMFARSIRAAARRARTCGRCVCTWAYCWALVATCRLGWFACGGIFSACKQA